MESPIITASTKLDTKDGKTYVSFSQYSIWLTCARQWKLSYYDKLKPDEKTIHLIFGTAIHETIQEWLDIVYNSANFRSINFDMDEIFRTKLLNLFKEAIRTDDTGKKIFICDQKTLKEFYLDGCAILDHVIKYKDDMFPLSGYELLGCEIPLDLDITPYVKFVGYLDIVIRHKKTGKIFIYDLKTSKSGWFGEKKDFSKLSQLLLYKKFYAQQYAVDEELIYVKFIILKRKINENSEWAVAKKRMVGFEPALSLKKAHTRFQEFLDSTFSPDGKVLVENLIPTPSEKACKFCPFRNKKELCDVSYYLEKDNAR